MAVIEEAFPTILIAPSGIMLPEMLSFTADLKARGAEVIAISDDERVRFVNEKALGALGIGLKSLLNNPLGRLGQLSATIKAALHDDIPPAPLTWRNTETDKTYTVLVQRLERDGRLARKQHSPGDAPDYRAAPWNHP